MNTHRFLLSPVLIAAIVGSTGCASSGATVSRADMNQTISVEYGRVVTSEQVQLESSAVSNAVLGGIIGALVAGKGNRAGGAAIGAAIGGVGTAAAEGSNTAFAYTIELSDGGTKKVVTEQSNVNDGDCVSFEEGQHTNVRRVSETLCDGGLVHPEVRTSHSQAADACHEAKEQLIAAEGEAAVDEAVRKVKALCDH
jgi:outer membrane lipoprotein SlyB